MSAAKTEITTVTCRWDEQTGATAGWYCEAMSDERTITDSQKIDFPVDLENFGREDGHALLEALADEFKDADIVGLSSTPNPNGDER